MYDLMEQLLSKKGLTKADMCRDLGINQSTVSTWKKAGRIGQKWVDKVARYLGVSVDLLITGTEEAPEGYYINEETRDMAQEIFQNKDLKLLFDAAKDASPEDLRTVHQMLLALKAKERNYDD